jgi:hypothetical protein
MVRRLQSAGLMIAGLALRAAAKWQFDVHKLDHQRGFRDDHNRVRPTGRQAVRTTPIVRYHNDYQGGREARMDVALEKSAMRKIYIRLLPFAVLSYILTYIELSPNLGDGKDQAAAV